ncbi:MAG: hypothetical protein GXO63_02235 [Candidatus Micrarchaeota archaeon]|nr:hypothetical protein [Candidatus Micrarchaeota archaeon]
MCQKSLGEIVKDFLDDRNLRLEVTEGEKSVAVVIPAMDYSYLHDLLLMLPSIAKGEMVFGEGYTEVVDEESGIRLGIYKTDCEKCPVPYSKNGMVVYGETFGSKEELASRVSEILELIYCYDEVSRRTK